MKTKRTFISIFTLCVALLLTACNGNGTSDTENSQNTQTESSTDSSDDSNTKLDDLYQQENQLFADHKDVWDKAFGMMNKSAADPNGNYADYLADTVERYEKSRNRSQNSKRKMPHQIARKTLPTMHLLLRIFPAKIMMAILLMKACFPKMQ